MYEAFYQLSEQPFNFTPDPRFLYQSEKHREAFAHLLYGIGRRSGFVMVTGEIGTGKTTICRALLNQLDPDIEMAYIFNPSLSPDELLRKINQEFGVDSEAPTLKELNDALNKHLIERNALGKNCVLVIDEAQNLTPGVLEQIRLLSNLETKTQKLIQILLIGQPELLQHLQLTQLRQLNQRIVARYHLSQLDQQETEEYIAYRLAVAGGENTVHFTPSALRAIYRFSGGTPRVINAICDRSLLIGYIKEVHEITAAIVKQAAQEVSGEATEPLLGLKGTLRSLLLFPFRALKTGIVRIISVFEDLSESLFHVSKEQKDKQETLSSSASATDQTESEETETTSSPDHEQDASAAKAPFTTASRSRSRVRLVIPILLILVCILAFLLFVNRNPAPLDEPPTPALPESQAKNAKPPTVETPAPPPAPIEPQQDKNSAVAPSPSTLEQLASMDRVALRNNGLTALLDYYDKPVPSEFPMDDSVESVARFATTNGLVCERIAPALDELTLMGLPGLIRVTKAGKDTNGNEETFWVGLIGIENDQFRLVTDTGDTLLVDRNDLREVYANEAAILWDDRDPDFPVLDRPMRGPYVNRLQKWLVLLDYLSPPLSGVYDDETARAVAKIQGQTGLPINGVANRQVRMVIESWLPIFPQQIAAMDPEATRKNAVEEILSAWQAGTPERFPTDDSAEGLARMAQSMGLEAQILRPGLDEVLAIGLPVLTRVTSGDKTHWVGLLGAQDGKVRLITDSDGIVRVNKNEFEEMFTHEAIVLSRNPGADAPLLKPGMKGPIVERIQRNLVRLGRLSEPISGVYDEDTIQAVAKIQTETGIKIDGIVGRQTRMVLNSWLGEEPLLNFDAQDESGENVVPAQAPPSIAPEPPPSPSLLEPTAPTVPEPVEQPDVTVENIPTITREESLDLPSAPIPKEVTPPAKASIPLPLESTAPSPPTENP